MVRNALIDRSSVVREKAAEWMTFRLQLRELLPELQAAVANEKHRQRRASMAFSLGMLRDGFVIGSTTRGRV